MGAIRIITKAGLALDSLGIRTPTREAQRRWLAYAALAGGFAGLISWLGLFGPIPTSIPANSSVPERVAAAALGQHRWSARAHLVRGADEVGWRRLRLGEVLGLRNSAVLKACESGAARLRRSVICEVRIGG